MKYIVLATSYDEHDDVITRSEREFSSLKDLRAHVFDDDDECELLIVSETSPMRKLQGEWVTKYAGGRVFSKTLRFRELDADGYPAHGGLKVDGATVYLYTPTVEPPPGMVVVREDAPLGWHHKWRYKLMPKDEVEKAPKAPDGQTLGRFAGTLMVWGMDWNKG